MGTAWEKHHGGGDYRIERVEFQSNNGEIMVTASYQDEGENIYDEVSVYIPFDEFKELITKLYKTYG